MGRWSSLRLFYLRAARGDEVGGVKPPSETARETRTVFRIIERQVPGTWRMTERFSQTRTRFVERLIAKTGRLIHREVSPVAGSTDLIYVIGPSAGSEAMVNRAANEFTAVANRIDELNILYRQRTMNKAGDTTAEVTRPTVYDPRSTAPLAGNESGYAGETKRVARLFHASFVPISAGKGGISGKQTPASGEVTSTKPLRGSVTGEVIESGQLYTVSNLFYAPGFSSPAAVSAASGSGTGYPELVYRRPETLSAGGSGYNPDASRALGGDDTNVYSQVSSNTSPDRDGDRPRGTTATDYREITVNLDFDYLSERLFKMLEKAERTEMERRGLI